MVITSSAPSRTNHILVPPVYFTTFGLVVLGVVFVGMDLPFHWSCTVPVPVLELVLPELDVEVDVVLEVV